MIKKDDTYYLTSAEKNSLPTETDPILAKGAPVREGDKYYISNTGEVGVFLSGEWTYPEEGE